MMSYTLNSMVLLQYCAREAGFKPVWPHEIEIMERLKGSRFVEQRADGVWVANAAGKRALDLLRLKPLE
jgi:hypothetical protein